MALMVTTTLSSSSTTRTLGCSRITRWSLDRQGDHEGRPATDPAAHAHRAAVALHDALRDPESESGPLAGLGREERLEDLGEHIVRNPLAGVAYLDLHGLASDDLGLGVAARLRRDRDGAALGHRVRGVEEKVEKDLLQLIRGRADTRQSRVELIRDLDTALPEPFCDKTAGLFDERVQIDVAHRFLLSIEAEHLTEDPRHPLRLARGDIEVRMFRGIVTEF